MLWPRKTSTRCLAQAALIARTAPSESSLVRSTPLISAPQADDSGVTSMSMTSCMGRVLRKMKALSRASCRLSSNRLCGGVVTSWMMLFTVSAASSARRWPSPDEAGAVVLHKYLGVRLDLRQRRHALLPSFASHAEGPGPY